jgi:hypothetical protein
LFGSTAIASVSHNVDGSWDIQSCISRGCDAQTPSTVLVVGTFASIAVLRRLTVVIERTRSIRLIRRAMSILSVSVGVVYTVSAELVVSTIGCSHTRAKGSRLRTRHKAVILRPADPIVSVVSTIKSLKVTSLAGKTISCISADSEFKRSGRRRSDCGSGWSGCGRRGILSFPSTCPCKSGRGEE